MLYLLQLHINPFSEWHFGGGICVLWTLFLVLNMAFGLKYGTRALLRHEKIPETHVLATLLTANAWLFNRQKIS